MLKILLVPFWPHYPFEFFFTVLLTTRIYWRFLICLYWLCWMKHILNFLAWNLGWDGWRSMKIWSFSGLSAREQVSWYYAFKSFGREIFSSILCCNMTRNCDDQFIIRWLLFFLFSCWMWEREIVLIHYLSLLCELNYLLSCLDCITSAKDDSLFYIIHVLFPTSPLF